MKTFTLLLLASLVLLCGWIGGRGSIATNPARQDPPETIVRGELLKAFQSAYAAFLRSKSFPNDKKNIANYDVQFTDNADNIVVFFAPRRQPGERPMLGNLTSLGVVVTFVVSKKDYRVVDIKSIR